MKNKKDSASQEKVPARLRYCFASYARTAVIMRQGPHDWVRLIHWDTDKDVFTPGQWIHAQVDEYNLSPSGRYLLTLVRNHAKPPHHWFALSRPPYFTALAMWYGMSDLGYCEFPEEGVILVDCTYYQPKPMDDFVLKEHVVLSRNEVIEKYNRPPMGRQPLHPNDGNEGLKNEGLSYQYWARTQVRYEENGNIILEHMGKETALSSELVRPAIDQRGRLIYTKTGDGTLYAATIQDDLSLKTQALANFDDQMVETLPPPAWAREYYRDKPR